MWYKIILIFVFGVFGGIFAQGILWPLLVERPLFYQYKLDANPVYRIVEKKETIIRENTALEQAVEKVEKAVVGIKTQSGEAFLEGSGLIVTSDGLAVTLASLVPKGAAFSFFVDGKAVPFEILKRDLSENLALVKLTAKDLAVLNFNDSKEVKLGERVFLVGVIFKNKLPKKIVNEGIVQSFNADFLETNILEKKSLEASPLFDIEGNILGLNTLNSEGKIISIPAAKIKQFIGF